MFEKNCQSFIFNNNKYVLDNNGELKQILVDCSRSGRENPHSNNKRMTNYLSHVYHYISDHTQNNKFLDHSCDLFRMNKKSNKLSYCSRYLEFGHTEDTKRLTYIESCHSSLCPSCNFFRARLNLSSFVAILSDFFNSEFRSLPFLFLTLTVPSCSGEDLPELLDQMSGAWDRLLRCKEFSRAFVATSRSLEITVNRDPDSKSYMMFHPHYHIILVARRDYFEKKSDLYLDNLHFLYLWQRAFKNHKFRSFSKWLSWYQSFFNDLGILDNLPGEKLVRLERIFKSLIKGRHYRSNSLIRIHIDTDPADIYLRYQIRRSSWTEPSHGRAEVIKE